MFADIVALVYRQPQAIDRQELPSQKNFHQAVWPKLSRAALDRHDTIMILRQPPVPVCLNMSVLILESISYSEIFLMCLAKAEVTAAVSPTRHH